MKFSKIAFALCLVSLLQAPRALAGKFVSFWTVAENQLAIDHGGRANTIAIHPGDPNQLFVTSESGGLFRSSDRGVHWSHVDSLPVIFTQAVVYVPSNPNIVLVSAKRDFKTSNGGGLWRSTNGGATWTQLALTVPGMNVRLSAHELSIMPGTGQLALATSQGVFLSSDNGATWTYSDAFSGFSDKSVFSVLATGGRIYAGGRSGIRIATANPLGAWTSPVSPAPPNALRVTDLHAFGRSPLSSSQVFVATSNIRLFHSNDAGMNWSQIDAPPGDGSCGGIGFIKAILRNSATAPVLDLYYGSRCWLWRLPAPVVNNAANFGGQWLRSEIDHADTRDLAFVNDVPVLLATDGGLHRTADQGVNWTFVGGGRLGGFNALQLYEVTGQLFEESGTKDLYIGTQDNNLWSFNMWGNWYKLYGAEGFNIELERRVREGTETRITFTACGGCANKVSDPRFANTVGWNDPPMFRGSPVLVPLALLPPSHYIEQVLDSKTLEQGLALTESSGQSWRQFAAFRVDRRDQPRVARPGQVLPGLSTIVYQPFRTNQFGAGFDEAERLIRIHKRPFSTGNGTVFFPAMSGFGALGINPTVFRGFQVYGIDTGDAFHLIAPDVVNEKMMETRDGGETWTEIPGLTSLVTENGKFLFRTQLEGNDPVFPHVTAVSFSPNDPNIVLIGTNEGGILESGDNGATWKKIAGSDPVTKITSFHWMDANNIFVSTYGRGLWRLRNTRIALPSAFEELCGGACDVVSNDGSPGRPPFAGSVLVFEGSVLGVRTDQDGRLREVIVKPGSSVVFTGDQNDPQDDILITESNGKDLGDVTPLPKPPDGWIAKGVVFGKDEVVAGTVFGETETSLVPPPSEKEYEGPTKSPTDGRPYIRLVTSDVRGFPAARPGEVFEVAATDFPPAAAYEALIDGEPVKGSVTADGNGAFTMQLTAPADKGYHKVQVRMVGGDVLDGSTMVVVHQDEGEQR